MILLKVFVTKLLQDVEDDLRVDTCHSESLKEASHAFLNVAVHIVLPLKVLFKSLLRSIVLSSNNLGNFVQADPTRIQKNFCGNFANLLLAQPLKRLFNGCVEGFWLDIGLLGDVTGLVLLSKHF